MASCSIDGCGKHVKARGWCLSHYQRWQRHADPLGGGTGMGEARKFFDETVVTFTGDGCLRWPFSTDNHGYGQMNVDGVPRKVSRLACIAVHGEPPSPKHEAAHNCGKGRDGCVNPRHLRWATHSENLADRSEHGTLLFGERSPRSVLKEDEAREIKQSRGTVSQRKLAAQFGISRWTVQEIHRGKNWARLEA